MPLVSIGKIKTKKMLNNKVRPYINVKFFGYPESLIPAELIPMLVLNAQYSNKELISADNTTSLEFSISDEQQILSTVSKAVILKEGKLKIVIPSLELARTLFLHNVHLTRTALRPNGLQGMATVDRTQSKTVIRFHQLSDYPLKNLQSDSASRHIRWLLLNPEVRQSFNSIYECLLQEKTASWEFNFSPPPLKGYRFKFLGNYDQEDPMLFHVDEIRQVKTPHFSYGNNVFISHPKKRELIPIEPKNGKQPEISRSDQDPELDFKATPGSHRKRDVVSQEGFSFICDSDDKVQVLPGKEQARVIPRINMNEELKRDISGVGHAIDSGSAQELDWAINRNDTDESILQGELKEVAATDNFQIFAKVIEQLMELPDYEYKSTHCLAMPKPSNSSRVYINKYTKEARTYHCAYFSYKKIPFVIIEIDISEIQDKHKLGSRLFGFSEDGREGLMHVMKACSEKGVHWDPSVNQKHCSVVVEIKHPSRTKKVEGEIIPRSDAEYKIAWIKVLNKAVVKGVSQ